jgi:peroxiredoxin
MKDLDGRVVLVDFFAAWCSNCKALAPRLASLHRKYKSRGLTIVGISGDAADVTKQTIQDWKIPYAVGADPAQQTQAVYRVSAIPAVFVVDRKGIIRDVLIGYDPTGASETQKLVEKLLAER